jgi:hypothetical protein
MNICKMSGMAEKTKKTAKVKEMVEDAIRSLKKPGGSSLHAITTYVSANYNVDAETLSPALKKYLKAAVASGRLLQPTGRGARGSFKLATMHSAISAEARAQDRDGCRRAPGPNRKKGQKQSTAKNTRPKSKLALKTSKKSPSKVKKVAKFHHHRKHPWLHHLAHSISIIADVVCIVASVFQFYCFLVGCIGQSWERNA